MKNELKKRGLAEYQEGLAFLAFFAAPLPNLEDMALSILADDFEKNGACELIQDDVRTLHGLRGRLLGRQMPKPSHHASRVALPRHGDGSLRCYIDDGLVDDESARPSS